jgi:hypothetical protein
MKSPIESYQNTIFFHLIALQTACVSAFASPSLGFVTAAASAGTAAGSGSVAASLADAWGIPVTNIIYKYKYKYKYNII